MSGSWGGGPWPGRSQLSRQGPGRWVTEWGRAGKEERLEAQSSGLGEAWSPCWDSTGAGAVGFGCRAQHQPIRDPPVLAVTCSFGVLLTFTSW